MMCSVSSTMTVLTPVLRYTNRALVPEPLAAGAGVRSQVSPGEIFGGRIVAGTGFILYYFGVAMLHRSVNAPYTSSY